MYARQALHRSYAGNDVARKVVILARECGLQLELSDVEVQSLVPSQLRDAQTPEAFLSGLAQVGGVKLSEHLRAPWHTLPAESSCLHGDGKQGNIKELMVGLALQFDEQMAQQAEAAASQGKKLCYVGLVDLAAKTCRVALEVRVSPLWQCAQMSSFPLLTDC